MPTSSYFISNGTTTNSYIQFIGDATINGSITTKVKVQSGIAPELYFRFVKKKLGILERMKLEKRLKALEKAFNIAVENGQSALGEKLLESLAREVKESQLLARGIKLFIEKSDIDKHKRNIRGGHISDTRFENYTRIVPKEILNKKKKVEDLFDGFVVYHYWNEEAEKKRELKQEMSSEEKSRMRDPILFGWIKECDRLYFIADWEDEYCDLSFEEIVGIIGKEEEEIIIPRTPNLCPPQT